MATLPFGMMPTMNWHAQDITLPTRISQQAQAVLLRETGTMCLLIIIPMPLTEDLLHWVSQM